MSGFTLLVDLPCWLTSPPLYQVTVFWPGDWLLGHEQCHMGRTWGRLWVSVDWSVYFVEMGWTIRRHCSFWFICDLFPFHITELVLGNWLLRLSVLSYRSREKESLVGCKLHILSYSRLSSLHPINVPVALPCMSQVRSTFGLFHTSYWTRLRVLNSTQLTLSSYGLSPLPAMRITQQWGNSCSWAGVLPSVFHGLE